MAAGAPTSCWARCTSCCSVRTSHSSWNAKWPASFGSRHSKGRTATWLLPNQNNVYCFDEHTDRIPLFHAEVRESVQRHHGGDIDRTVDAHRSEEHTSELRHRTISYAVFCLKKKKKTKKKNNTTYNIN